MPTSPYGHTDTLVSYLNVARPSSILDIGVGNGKIGFIARDLLDVMLGERYRKEDWQIRIDGIEVFQRYIQEHQNTIYDNIHIGNAFEVIDTLGTYDMIILGDVLEHFDKPTALEFLEKCIVHSTKDILICIPLGQTWQQPDIYNNPYERHLSFWTFNEFHPICCKSDLFDYRVGPYGTFLINRNDYIAHKNKLCSQSSDHEHTDSQTVIRNHFSLFAESVDKIDLTSFAQYLGDNDYGQYFLDTQFKEHYRLIAHLSTHFNRSTIFDIGTNKGYSALALSYNPSNRVISYDINDCIDLANQENLSRIEYLIGDVRQDPRLLSSPFIMLDTDHDGTFENEFYNYLLKNEYKGILFLDDIHLNKAMIKFWTSLPETKEDLTDLGHYTGSGLVVFQ